MQIAWLQDYDIFLYQGGAEMNDAEMFRTGLKRGHDLFLIGPQVPFRQPEAVIVSNTVSFDKYRLENMFNSAPTVFFLHDYIFCKYRLFYPMINHCRKCEHAQWWIEQYKKAKLLIWLSPLHRNTTLLMFPELNEIPYALIPSAIKADNFLIKEEQFKREAVYLSVNGLFPFKGRDNLISYATEHPDRLFHVLSQEVETGLPGNIIILPPETYDQMPKLYRKYEYYIELPSTPQPFNRTIMEAKLSGCKIITNQLMGAASYPWFKDDPNIAAQKLSEASGAFWTTIEKTINT